jgi:hypothetical protein
MSDNARNINGTHLEKQVTQLLEKNKINFLAQLTLKPTNHRLDVVVMTSTKELYNFSCKTSFRDRIYQCTQEGADLKQYYQSSKTIIVTYENDEVISRVKTRGKASNAFTSAIDDIIHVNELEAFLKNNIWIDPVVDSTVFKKLGERTKKKDTK